jgi:ribonuclease-3
MSIRARSKHFTQRIIRAHEGNEQMTKRRKSLEKSLGYKFRNKRLLGAALVHRSYRFETNDVGDDNQRLEFLGDAALGLLAAAYTYKEYPDSDEGVLTTARSRIASGQALAGIAQEIELGDALKVGRGEEKSGGRNRTSNLADALEAILGAAYLDGGARAVDKIFRKLFLPRLQESDYDPWHENPKGRLQELAQRKWKTSPRYKSVSMHGPSHAREFCVEVYIDNKSLGSGKGRSKREAESNAAEEAVRKLVSQRRRRAGRKKS